MTAPPSSMDTLRRRSGGASYCKSIVQFQAPLMRRVATHRKP